MDIRALILDLLKRQGSVRTAEVVKRTGFSRAYVNRFFKELCGEGTLILLGKANTARYIAATGTASSKSRQGVLEVHKILANRGLAEDVVLRQIKDESGIFHRLPANVIRILDYAFTEMLNNAIEHSHSKKIVVRMKRSAGRIAFKVVDQGVGIFKAIKRARHLGGELEAIQELIKGKLTTDPKRHSGEGIFFTSKVGDRLLIKGSGKKLVFDNKQSDVFVEDITPIVGTAVEFSISERSKKELGSVFSDYAGEGYEFAKTIVTIELFKTKGDYISRSQARRVLAGLEKFKTVVLDFKGVPTVGQAFADEVFRVWKQNHPAIGVDVRNANENIQLMIQHVSTLG
jgi:anti-sigma regulatory factor (Ser/Thr protein kinase)